MANAKGVSNTSYTALSASLGQQKVVGPGSTEYNAYLGSYYSAQQRLLQPACIVSPQSVEDVSTAVKALVRLREEDEPASRFAVRSGGHSSWVGASNIEGGSVIDLSALKTIELSADEATVSVGVGATCGEVYEALEPYGSGGLTLGGGISYTSTQFGWTCDTVTKFQIVLADGSIVEADSTSRPDLFWALKGGGGNFGVVTNITFTTFKQGPIWSGTAYHMITHADDMIREFVKFNSADSYDEHAAAITTFAYAQARGMVAVTNLLSYTKEVTGTPAPFEGFLAIPSIYNATTVTNMIGIAKATGALNPSGNRSINLTATLVSNESVIKAAYEKWNASYPIVKDVPNLLYCFVLEPLPPAFYGRHAKENALGLDGRTDALVIALLSIAWSNASDDDLVYSTSNALIEDIKTAAKGLGGLDPYMCMSYGGQGQDIIGSYGAENVRRLKQVRQEVDPRGIFTHQVAGGHKIPDN